MTADDAARAAGCEDNDDARLTHGCPIGAVDDATAARRGCTPTANGCAVHGRAV